MINAEFDVSFCSIKEDKRNKKLKCFAKEFLPLILNKLFEIESIKSGFNYTFNTLCFDVLFCDNEYIRQINKEYRQKDSATDVITFSLFIDDETKFVLDDTINLGEIIISLDTAKSQAQEAGHTIEKEILTLLTHGLLHLLGFDHRTNEEYNFVVQTQNEVLSSLDVSGRV